MKATGDDVVTADVLVIGGGLAGGFASLKAKEEGAKEVVLIDRAKMGKSGCSAFAAGVIAVCFPEEDNVEDWFKLTVELGDYLNDQDWVIYHLNEAHKLVKEMETWGVTFEKTKEGKLERRLMRCASDKEPTIKQIMFHGPQMMDTLRKKVLATGVKVIDRVRITDLLKNHGRVVGAVGFDTITGEFKVFKAKATVLATGGTAYKSLFASHKMLTGDGHAMVWRAGGDLMHYERGAHHATCAWYDLLGMNIFVSLGAKFVNVLGEEFLADYDPVFKDHTKTYIYAGAMAMEHRAGRGPIFFDMTHFTEEEVRKLRTVIPLSVSMMERGRIIVGDKFVKKMEWVPTNFGNIGSGGGAKIDLDCHTSLPELFAGGDAACGIGAGTYGFPLIAIPFAITSGARSGEMAAKAASASTDVRINREQQQKYYSDYVSTRGRKTGIDPEHAIIRIQEVIIRPDVYLISREEAIKNALKEIEEIRAEEIPFLYSSDVQSYNLVVDATNMALCAEIWLRCLLTRKESRAGVMREDYPFRDNINWLKWIVVNKGNDDRIHITLQNVPLERFRLQPVKNLTLHPIFEAAKRRGVQWG